MMACSRSMQLWIILVICLVHQSFCEELDLNDLESTDPGLGKILSKYDLNGDGILNDMEIDISYSEIEADISQYDKKQKELDEKSESENKEGTDDDVDYDEVEIDAEDEDKEEVKKKSPGGNPITIMIIVASGIGGALIVLVIYVLNKEVPEQKSNEEDKLRQREEWLNRISKQGNNEEGTGTTSSSHSGQSSSHGGPTTSHNGQTSSHDGPTTSHGRATDNRPDTLRNRHKTSRSDRTSHQEDSPEERPDNEINSTDTLGSEGRSRKGNTRSEITADVESQEAGNQESNPSTRGNLQANIANTSSKGTSSENLNQRQVQESNKLQSKAMKEDEEDRNDSKDELKYKESGNPEGKSTKGDEYEDEEERKDTKDEEEERDSQTVPIDTDNQYLIEKRPDTELVPGLSMQFTLITFLEDVLSCKIEMKSARLQYSLGNLKLTETDLPKHVEEIPEKMGAIMKLIVPRQISRVRYAIECFERCEDNLSHIKNCEIMSSVAIYLKMKNVEVIFEAVNIEQNEDNDENDLWTDIGGADVPVEGALCLWRISGWSKDGVTISPRLLSHLLDYGCHGDKCVHFLVTLIQAGGKQIQKVKRLDEIVLQESNTLRGMEILLSNGNIGQVLAKVLHNEVTSAAENLGSYFENRSIFGPLLSITSVPNMKKVGNVMSLTGNSVLPFAELQRKSPQPLLSDISFLEKSIQEGFHQCQNNLHSALKRVITNKATREFGLSWWAAVIGLNDLRTASLEVTDTQAQTCCSDGFMLNFCGAVLKFFVPIFGDQEKREKIDLNYSTSPACRLNFHFETCLAGGQIVREKESQNKIVGTLPENLQDSFNFITECYHLAQRTLSIGVIPAITHYNRMHRNLSSQLESVKETPKEQEAKQTYMLLTMMWETSLADAELVKNVTMFYLTQAKLLLGLFANDDDNKDRKSQVKEERLAFQHIPEFCVKDMAVWFQYVAGYVIHTHKGILWGLPISDFVDCCVLLLERPDIMPGPIVASKIVTALLQFVQTSPQHNSGMLGGSRTSGMSDLSLMVHTSPTVKTKLGPALLHTYVSVDVVEGLDVDRDEFDKYGARAQIGRLIQHLWDRQECKDSILQQHNTDQFTDFLGATLDTLVYMLNDSLSRMANVRRTELVKDNASEWNALSDKEQQDRLKFLSNEEHVGRGFMTMANQTLSFILLLTEEQVVSSCFNKAALAQRSASTICGFLLSLCGAKAKDYKVKNMAKYRFDPKTLLSNIVKIILHICQSKTDGSETNGERFKKALVEDSDFELEALQKAYDVIYSKGLTCEEFMDQFASLIQELKELNNNSKSAPKNTDSEGSDWLKIAAASEIDEDTLAEEYTKMMSSLRFDTTDIADSHSFQSNVQSIDMRSPKVKTLMKEMKQLQQNLPVHPDAAIFVRQDEDRMDLMRAMVTGPVDTPYSNGCFLFDIYFPSSYPNNPPLVKLVTTGNGTVRFNPNLYSDGKVCLSLLGTWHAGDASEKWNPVSSTLYQVLVSIQSMILTSDPVFNEPGYEGIRGTEDGKKQSNEYNWKIQLHTLRHAILGNLRNPPPGFEGLIKRHYYIQKTRVLKQCSDWLSQCSDEDLRKRLRVVCEDIRQQLNQLELPPLDGDSDGDISE